MEPEPALEGARYASDRAAAPGPGHAFGQAGTDSRPVTRSDGSGNGPAAFRPGQRVRHPAIGPGKIEKVISDGPGIRVIVCFENGARLTMDLAVAKLEALD